MKNTKFAVASFGIVSITWLIILQIQISKLYYLRNIALTSNPSSILSKFYMDNLYVHKLESSEITLTDIEKGKQIKLTVDSFVNQQSTVPEPPDKINSEIINTESMQITGGFFCKNIHFDMASSNVSLRIIGEITNNSGKHYDLTNFKMSIYDNQNALMDTGNFMIANFEKNQTRSFEALLSKPQYPIHHYKIDFDSGI
jgi:hypothetical protein